MGCYCRLKIGFLHSVYVLTVNSFSLFFVFFLLEQKKDAIDTAALTVLLGGLSPERAFFLEAVVS